MIDKNYFLTRLANGEDIDAIGEEMATLMTEAINEYQNQQAQASKDARKHEIILELLSLIQEMADLEGFADESFEVTEEDVEMLIEAFDEMFGAMRELKELKNALERKCVNRNQKIDKSDDDVLAEFIKMFS